MVTNVLRKHVFDDLQPYLCTTESCEDSKILFHHSGEWARHENLHDLSEPSSSECPFCSAMYQVRGPAYFKHVSGHLREVSLFVLPQPVDEDEALDSSDSNASSTLEERLSLDEKDQQTPSVGAKEKDTDLSTAPGPASKIDPATQDNTREGVEMTLTPADKGNPTHLKKNEVPRSQPQLDVTTVPSTQAAPSRNAAGGSSDGSILDNIIDRLLSVLGSRPGKEVQLLESDIRYLCKKSREIFLSQPVLLELGAPMVVCVFKLNPGVCLPRLTRSGGR